MIFFRNRWQKAVAVFLATMIYLAVRTSSDAELSDGPENQRRFAEIPVAVLAPAADTVVYKLTPPVVTAVVVGEKTRLDLLQPKEIEVFVSVLSGEPLDRLYPLHVHVPPGFQIRDLSPVEVQVEGMTSSPSYR